MPKATQSGGYRLTPVLLRLLWFSGGFGRPPNVFMHSKENIT